MKRILSLLLAAALCLSALGTAAFAEADAIHYSEASGYYYVEKTDAQAFLAAASKDKFLQADGLYFKDMNGNGTLDVYEDWRVDMEERIADLIAQMTVEEEVGLLFQVQPNGSSEFPAFTDQLLYSEENPFAMEEGGQANMFSVSYFVNGFNINSFLDNVNGLPTETAARHNTVQVMAENTRLGVPVTFSCDRQYDSWGGYIDVARNAFGVSDDLETLSAIWKRYAEEMTAIGFQVSLNPSAAQLTSANGEDVKRVSEHAAAEITAYQSGGMEACSKHFIFGGQNDGKTRYTDYYGNQAETWKAVIDAGTTWIMTNNGVGFDGTSRMDYDAETMFFLRNTLGYEGIVITDIWPIGQGDGYASFTMNDGTTLDKLSVMEKYRVMLENGVDIFLSIGALHGTDVKDDGRNDFPDVIVEAVKSGDIDKTLVDRAATRILRSKFRLGQFENPYSDIEAVQALCYSEAYLENPWELDTMEAVMAARNPEIVALEEKVMVSSAVLLRNDGDVLPLAKDTKVYFTSNNSLNNEVYAKALQAVGTVVDTMEEADVVVADFTRMDDAAELIVDDAVEAGKKLVAISQAITPNEATATAADAVLYLPFKNSADHGSPVGGYMNYTTPAVYADILYGVSAPTGKLANEIARSDNDGDLAWSDLPDDAGVSNYVRMIMLAMLEESDDNTIPSNFSAALFGSGYGMTYGTKTSFRYDTLAVPSESQITGSFEFAGSVITFKEIGTAAQASGVPFTINFLLWNEGDADATEKVQVMDGNQVIAEQLVAVKAGSWRVVEMDVALEGEGDHVLNVGTLSKKITVQ